MANDPARWFPIFYPQEEAEVDVTEYLDDDGMPDFDGATIKYAEEAYSPDEAQDILMSLLGSPEGVLTAEDGLNAS